MRSTNLRLVLTRISVQVGRYRAGLRYPLQRRRYSGVDYRYRGGSTPRCVPDQRYADDQPLPGRPGERGAADHVRPVP